MFDLAALGDSFCPHLVQRTSFCHLAFRSENSTAGFPRLVRLFRSYFDNPGLHLGWHLMHGNFWVRPIHFSRIIGLIGFPVRAIQISELRKRDWLLTIVGLHSLHGCCQLWMRLRGRLSLLEGWLVFGIGLGRWSSWFFVFKEYFTVSTCKTLENLVLLLFADVTV